MIIPHGVWILAMVLQIGQYETIVKPYKFYDDNEFGKYFCEMDKKELSKELREPMACIREEDT